MSAAAGEPAADVPAAELVAVTKRFGPVLANDAIDLAVAKGEIHAVVGENGAGKSTLMSVLYGLHRPDSGHVRREGRRIRLRSPPTPSPTGSAWCTSVSGCSPSSPWPRTW
ncbi:ATP-binding cassette domain-containing protein [Thermocatellispora tengchongensis]|uniref:ATP-binding cassette domain-containing protein n=1 Tax=Thermocatellispora tengchongensis TaxID=1073253 RepID=UPI003642835B